MILFYGKGLFMAKRKKKQSSFIIFIMVLYRVFAFIIARRWLFIGSCAGIGLAAISMYFNWQVGYWSGFSALSSVVFGAGYVALDVELMFLSRQLQVGIQNLFLRIASFFCCALLFVLTLWTGFTYFAALDSQHVTNANKRQIERLEQQFSMRQAQAGQWMENFEKTEKFKSKFDSQVDDKITAGDDLLNKITKLEADTPPPFLIVFKKYESYFKTYLGLNADDFQMIARIVFGFAFAFSSMICVAVAAGEHARMSRGDTVSHSSKSKWWQWSNLNSDKADNETNKAHLRSGGVDTSINMRLRVETERYEQVKNQVLAGEIGCDHKSIKSAGFGSANATEVQQRLVASGYLIRTGKGYKIADAYKIRKVANEPVLKLIKS